MNYLRSKIHQDTSSRSPNQATELNILLEQIRLKDREISLMLAALKSERANESDSNIDGVPASDNNQALIRCQRELDNVVIIAESIESELHRSQRDLRRVTTELSNSLDAAESLESALLKERKEARALKKKREAALDLCEVS
jgi:predicted ribosome quality control (RQC) complex YloA/Tae2 family protein